MDILIKHCRKKCCGLDIQNENICLWTAILWSAGPPTFDLTWRWWVHTSKLWVTELLANDTSHKTQRPVKFTRWGRKEVSLCQCTYTHIHCLIVH